MGYNNGDYPAGYDGNEYRYKYPDNSKRRGYSRPRKKHSGAKEGVQTAGINKGKLYVTAWNYSRGRGMITVKAFENKKSKAYEVKKTGNRFVMMMFEVFYKRTGNTVLELASYNLDSGKVYLEKLGMVISCQAPNGGYFGQIKSK